MLTNILQKIFSTPLICRNNKWFIKHWNALLCTKQIYCLLTRLPDLVDFVKKMQKELHNPPTLGIDDPQRQLEVLITSGSQDGICKVHDSHVTYIASPAQDLFLDLCTWLSFTHWRVVFFCFCFFEECLVQCGPCLMKQVHLLPWNLQSFNSSFLFFVHFLLCFFTFRCCSFPLCFYVTGPSICWEFFSLIYFNKNHSPKSNVTACMVTKRWQREVSPILWSLEQRVV